MLSIGAFSKASHVSTKTLRYYDEIGLLKPVYVNGGTGYRYYAVEQLETLLLINRLKAYCFTLEEIAEVLGHSENEDRLLSLLQQKRSAVQEKLHYYDYVLHQLENDVSDLERGMNIMAYLDHIEIKLVETQPKNILSIRDKMNVEDYSKYLGRLFETIAKENLSVTGEPISIFHDEQYDPKNYEMEIAIPVKETVQGTREFAGGLCALSVLKGPYSELPSVYAKMKQWIEKGEYEPAGVPYEIYITNPAQTAPKDFITEVYFPVKKA